MTKYEAVSIIEVLRAGISSRKVSKYFNKAREKELEVVLGDIEQVLNEQISFGSLFNSDYGEGKTHFLKQIWNEAENRNFAVSFVSLSKDTPFSNLKKVYATLVANTYLPNSVMPGFEWKLGKLHSGRDEVQDIMAYCENNLHPRIGTVLRNYFEDSQSNAQNRFALSQDLSGQFINVANLKAIHRLNFAESVKFPRFTNENVIDYFRFLSAFIKYAGYSGWVVIFDEAELIGKLGKSKRAKAYFNMSPFLYKDAENGLESTYTIFSFTSDFKDTVIIGGNQDILSILEWLEDREDTATISKVRPVLTSIRDDCIFLNPLTDKDVREILSEICKIHCTAYEWEHNLDIDQVLHLSQARLRSKIKAAIFSMDLRLLYGENVKIDIGKLDQGSISEDDEFFGKDDDETIQ